MEKLRSISSYGELKSTLRGFTIVELLVVIVVIGILASITVVSYTGVTQKAIDITLKSDLANAKKQLMMYKSVNDSYPTALDLNGCPSAPFPDTSNCLVLSEHNEITSYVSDGAVFGLEVTNNSATVYSVTDGLSPRPGAPSLAATDPTNWIQVGSQVWARKNQNVGTRVNGSVNQTNNGGTNIIEKYCYNDQESNCTAYGGLYQWDEAMVYSTTDGAQGICPVGTHIPSDNDWKVLEMYLGMTQSEANLTGFRGTDQGHQIIPGGTSGLNVLYAGYRRAGEFFNGINGNVNMWSSTQSGVTAYNRHLDITNDEIDRSLNNKVDGFPVRCLENQI